jgi:flagellar basal body-associated protein FliL
MDLETGKWLIGLIVIVVIALVGGLLALWWKVEQRQDKAICSVRVEVGNFRKNNAEEHTNIRKEISDTREALAKQHIAILDRINDVYQYMLNGTKRNMK